jgi:hypothetical protein
VKAQSETEEEDEDLVVGAVDEDARLVVNPFRLLIT